MNSLRRYEQKKAKLRRMKLSPTEYERRLKAIIERLGV